MSFFRQNNHSSSGAVSSSQPNHVGEDHSSTRDRLLSPNGSDEEADDSSTQHSYSRMLTFSRALTFDTATLKRTFTMTLGLDSEEAWTKGLLEEYHRAATTGNYPHCPVFFFLGY
jgi:hypothetical protein